MASARTYQLAKDPALKLDPFNFSMTAGSAESVAALIQKTQPQPGEALDIAGRSPGSWTLPVCNASTWGKRWNWDYTKKKDGGSHPPCICGKFRSIASSLSCSIHDHCSDFTDENVI